MAKFKRNAAKADERETVDDIRLDANYSVYGSVPGWVERIIRERSALGHKRAETVRTMLIEMAAIKYPDRVPVGAAGTATAGATG